jgi:hypothetical protein
MGNNYIVRNTMIIIFALMQICMGQNTSDDLDSTLSPIFKSIVKKDDVRFNNELKILKNVDEVWNDCTPLMAACQYHNITYARKLLSKGANIHYLSSIGTPLFAADYCGYYQDDDKQNKMVGFLLNEILSPITKSSKWKKSIKNKLPSNKEIKQEIANTLLTQKRTSKDAYTLIQLFDASIVDSKEASFIVKCDVSILTKDRKQMFDVVNVSGKSMKELKGIETHIVLLSDLPEKKGDPILTGFNKDELPKWTFCFTQTENNRWKAKIKDYSTADK